MRLRTSTELCRCLSLALISLCAIACTEPVPGEPNPIADASKGTGQKDPAEKLSRAADGTLCLEHGVLEAVCTKHNPALIPVFQAKGDWCAEHGFPESFCPICHPERGGRPAADVKDDGAPPDGTKVRFKSLQTARQAGIETARAIERSDVGGIAAVARLSYDASKLALVSARAPGLVQAVKADVGSKVEKGSALATVMSASAGADRSRLSAARSRVEVAEAAFKRTKSLHLEKIAALKDVQDAQQEWDAATAEYDALAAAVGLVGGSGGELGSYTLTAPIAGIVIRREVSIGVMVDTHQPLFTIVDTSVVWAELDVPEVDMLNIASGQRVTLTFDGLGEREFTGEISYIAPELNPHSRTLLARVPLLNPDGMLRANLFGQARIAVGTSQAAVAVPRAAVQKVKAVSLVFVRIKEDEYEVRRVSPGNLQEGDHVVLTKGIKPNEEVVTTGSFLLKTETLKGSIGAGCCDVE